MLFSLFLFKTSEFEPPNRLTGGYVVNLFSPYHLVALPYIGNVIKAFSLIPSGYEMAAERMELGLMLPRFNI